MKRALLIGLSIFIATYAYAITNVPEFKEGLKKEAVWEMSPKDMRPCNEKNTPEDYLDCVIAHMQKEKASDQAIAMMKLSRGWITDYKKFGNITVAHVAVPAADHSDAYYLINDSGDVINVDDAAILTTIDIKKSSNYSEIAKRFPNISLWPGNHQYPTFNQLPGGIQQLVFHYPLLNGCHACELAGFAEIAFNFDSDGRFISTQLLGLHHSTVAAS